MKSFSDRNPVPIGIAGLLIVVLTLFAASRAEDLPIVGGGTTYTAQFAEIAGLKPGNDVRVSGVRVGKVTDIALDGDKVAVDFRVKDVVVGDASTVAIEIKTLLGQKYVALVPRGDAPLDPDTVIPVDRTRAPFDTTDALEQLSRTVDDIDTTRLAKSFDTISETFADTRPEVRATLEGLSKLSATVAGRDRQLGELLGNTEVVTGTLAARDKDLRSLLGDGNLLLAELQARKSAIDRLLTGTRDLAAQLRGVVADNQAQLRPALEKLYAVAGVLERNQASLAKGIKGLAPFYRVFGNTLSNGRWFDVYVCGVLPPNVDLTLLNFNSGGCTPPRTNAGGN